MSIVVYTDPGLMDRQIDIWDQPGQPNSDGSAKNAILFATGVYAQITGLWATTLAQKLTQQVVTELSHKIVIRYLAGMRTRMFILYNDPDSTDDQGNIVPRRFDIDRIIDPDEHKFELMILAIERNDGQ